MIVVVAHIKGGCGKTTAATQLALHRRITHPERKIWLVDADSQQSALDTVSIRADQGLQPDLSCSAYTTARQLISQINSQGRMWDDIIVDCGGRDTETMRAALLGADVLLVPILPRAYDVWSLSRLQAVIEAARTFGANFTALAFLNRKDRSAECKEAQKFLEANKTLTLLQTSLSDRMAYAKASGSGRAVSEMRPCDKKAVEEIAELSREIFKD